MNMYWQIDTSEREEPKPRPRENVGSKEDEIQKFDSSHHGMWRTFNDDRSRDSSVKTKLTPDDDGSIGRNGSTR